MVITLKDLGEIILLKANKKEESNLNKPLALHSANCIVCKAKIQQTTESDKSDIICYKCYQAMWGKQHQTKQVLKKAACN